ncbi:MULTISPECIES: hypothetical protein [unclassified Sedimentibacter]|uniref:hypothetical protein n=1 Tax=unclassified Sedimentibacter TaxID=2649220 RepID=UPI0027DF8EC8|nr:hypothetical protein [Sedimentibacter sp. MB35-C1]WMJ77208.1 hypothetical protein RBQ61_16805 [Sedimentibacter sp. MB35-C1]
MSVKDYNSNKLINFTMESLSENINNLIGPLSHDPDPCGGGCSGACTPGCCDVPPACCDGCIEDWPPSVCPNSIGITPNAHTY